MASAYINVMFYLSACQSTFKAENTRFTESRVVPHHKKEISSKPP